MKLQKEYLRHLDGATLKGSIMWVLDADNVIVDITPTAAAYADKAPEELIGLGPDETAGFTDQANFPRAKHHYINKLVMGTGTPQTYTDWINVRGDEWNKIIFTKTKISDKYLLVICHDITDTDPRAQWLSRIDLETQRLNLDGGRCIKFDEFAVLHMSIRGLSRKTMGERMHISPKTVDYRMGRIRQALGVETTEELLLAVAATGMIHLLTIEFDPSDPAMTASKLYQRATD